jgi:hypothetical protein
MWSWMRLESARTRRPCAKADETLMYRGHDLWLATLKWVAGPPCKAVDDVRVGITKRASIVRGAAQAMILQSE